MPERKNQPADKTRFADLLKGVKTITSDRVVHHKPRPQPVPRQANLDKRNVMDALLVSPGEHADIQTGDSLAYMQPGIQKRVFKKLKKGQYCIEAELDLHGLTRDQAQAQLNTFINTACARGLRCVRIIHGKGHGSSNKGPVIKPLVNQWLRRRAEILAFCSARPSDGGTGAVYVLVKSA